LKFYDENISVTN